MVRGRGARIRVPGAAFQRGGEQLAAKLVDGVAVLDVLVVGVEARLEVLVGYVDLLSEFLERIGLHEAVAAFLDEGGHGAAAEAAIGVGIVDDGVVVDGVHPAAGLREDGGADDVAASIFTDEAVAFLVDVDACVHAAGDDVGGHARPGVADLQQLDLIHIHQIRAGFLRHDDAVAGDGGHVGGDEAFAEVRPLLALAVLHAHFHVAGEAARGQHDALAGVQGDLVAVLRFGDHADNGAVIVGDEALAGRFHDDGHVVLRGEVVLEGLDIAGAVGHDGRVGAAIERADALGDGAVEFHAHAFQPVQAVERVGAQHGDQIEVGDFVAAFPGLLDVEVHGVFDAERFLQLRIGRVVDAAGNDGVAAEEAGLFDQDHGRAFVAGGNRRSKARAAAAHDNHVGGHFFILHGSFFGSDHERVAAAACLLDAIAHGGDDGAAGHGHAGHGVDGERLRVEDAAGDGFNGDVAHAGGFDVAFLDFDGLDLILGEGYVDRHVAVLAERGGFVGAGGVAVRFGGFAGEAGFRRRQHRFAGDGCAGNGVHLHGVLFHHRLGEGFGGLSAERGRFVRRVDYGFFDYAVFNGQRDRDGAAEALLRGRERFRHARGSQSQAHDEREQRCEDLLHEVFLLQKFRRGTRAGSSGRVYMNSA